MLFDSCSTNHVLAQIQRFGRAGWGCARGDDSVKVRLSANLLDQQRFAFRVERQRPIDDLDAG
jgi:hypothetical protein